MRLGVGNFGFNQEHAAASYLNGKWSERLTGSRDFSSGFRTDRDYRSSSAASETYIKTALGNTDILLAGSDRPFGADQFYGDFPSWERTKTWFASIFQELGKNTDAAFGYRRHSDEFILVRGDPAIYENNHVSQSWQADIRRRSSFRNDWTLTYGAEGDGDEIDSNNLGHHARNREAAYVNLDLQSFHRMFLSVGAREEIFSGSPAQFIPSIAAGLWLRKGLRLRGSGSRSFRLPTYTDLYYSDPASIGNPLLKPESAWDFEGGPEWDNGGRVSAQLTLFTRQEHNDIDYIRPSSNSPWRATNINHIGFVGIEASAKFRLPKSEQVELAYTALHADQQIESGFTSEYVFNYPTHNAIFSWLAQFRDIVGMRTRVGATQRVGKGAYALWDVALCRTSGAVRPYLQLTNLSNRSYQEIPGVVMPGRAIIGGVELIFKR
jgi:outer membrane cobalamin receptor